MNCIQDCKSLFNNSSVALLKKNILGDSENLMCLTRLQDLYLIYVQFRHLDRMIQVVVAFFNSVIPKHNRGKYFY